MTLLPTRRLRQAHDKAEDEETHHNLESNWESPGYIRWFQEREAEIDPITERVSIE